MGWKYTILLQADYVNIVQVKDFQFHLLTKEARGVSVNTINQSLA